MKYVKKPIEIEAIQFCGGNAIECLEFVGNAAKDTGNNINGDITQILITTLEGDMRADLGDYIIKGIKGEFYPCKPDIFESSYDKVEV